MFCPRCGQEQVSDSTRFCSRCGFLLETVSEVLRNGGVLPQLAELSKNKKFLSRKNGLKIGVLWAVVLWLLVPILGIADAPDELTGGAAVLGFAGAVIIMLISFFFLDNTPSFSVPSAANLHGGYVPNNLSGNRHQSTLPPQHSQPVESYMSPANTWKSSGTEEFAKPRSVTEGTTKLLHEDE